MVIIEGEGAVWGEYNAEMAYWSMIDSCVKSWQYFSTHPTQITSLNSVSNSLSYDIVRFKIELGVEEKFMCKNVTKQTQHGNRPVQRIARAYGRQSFCSSTAYSAYGRMRRVAESSRIWLGSTQLNSFTLYFNIRHSARWFLGSWHKDSHTQ